MRSRDRVWAAIRHQVPDRVPKGEFYLEDGLVAALLGLPPGSPVALADRQRCLADLGFDLVGGYARLPGGAWLLGLSMAAGLEGREPGARTAARRFGLPRPRDLDWSLVRYWARETDLFVFCMVPGVFSEPAYMLGMEEYLAMTAADPAATVALAAAMAEYNVEFAECCVEAGAHGILIGDDIAWDGGLFLAPDRWRELLLPALARQVEGTRGLGAPVFYHADGNIGAVLPDLAALGIAGLHSLQPSAGMDLAAVKARWGRQLCLWGNVDLGFPLTLGSLGEIERVVAETIRAGAPGGGYIFGSAAGDLGADLPPERVRAMYAAAAACGPPAGLRQV